MKEMIKIEYNERTIEGTLVDLAELNKIAVMGCRVLTYLMNIMDDNTTNCYMWLKDDDNETNYFVKI